MAVALQKGAFSVVLGIAFLGCSFAFKVPYEIRDYKTIIGIDLGSTYSRVGGYRNGYFDIIANDRGNRTTPSWVGFTDGDRLIGDAAKNQAAVNPERTVFNVKRLIGRRFEDEEVQRYMKLVPFKIVNKDGKPCVEVNIKDGEVVVFSPEEISAMIMTKMKETAEAYLGRKIKDAVVAVPAYFDDAQRQAMKDAGAIAGLNVVRIMVEPIAAAVAYGYHKKFGETNILVFNLGGGTFDVNILNVDSGVFEVLSTNSDTHLGGEDFDERIMEYFITLIKEKHGKDISKDNKALSKLRREAERAKIDLSSQNQTRVEIESLFDGVDFSEPLTRSHFEELNNDLFEKTMALVKKGIDDSGLEKHKIHEIILVGGSTMIPKIQQLLEDYLDGKKPVKDDKLKPDEAVAFGAAVQGGLLSGEGQVMSGFGYEKLSKEEIDRMINEAEEYAEGDKKAMELIDARNSLTAYVYSVVYQISDEDKLAEKLEADEKEMLETVTNEAIEWLDKSYLSSRAEKEDYDDKLKEVEAVCNPIIMSVYQRSGGASGGRLEEDIDGDVHVEL